MGRVRRCFGLTKFISWKWKAVALIGPPTVDDQMYSHEFCHKCFTQKDAVFTSHDKGRRSSNTICEWRSSSLWRSAKACKAFTVADGCAVKSDARVTCQIIWQPGYLTPNMWKDSLIPPPPPHSLWFCRSGQIKLVKIAPLVKNHPCALCSTD